MISMTATLPRIHDRPTSSQLASSVVVVEHRPPPHDRDLGLRRALAVVDLLQHGHEALVRHLRAGEGRGGGEGDRNGGHGLLVSPPIPAGLRLPAGGRTFSPSCPRCAAARIMFSTPRALSGFTSAILETALK